MIPGISHEYVGIAFVGIAFVGIPFVFDGIPTSVLLIKSTLKSRDNFCRDSVCRDSVG